MRKLTLLTPLAVAALALSACSSSAAGAPAVTGTSSTSAASACGTTVDQIATSAAKEGAVNLIALPDTWANYGGILKSYRDLYKINATVANPDASSSGPSTLCGPTRMNTRGSVSGGPLKKGPS